MEEFNFAEGGTGRGRNIGRIVGFREHVFTHDVSAVANFFSLQELNFVSATQRALDNPLHVRLLALPCLKLVPILFELQRIQGCVCPQLYILMRLMIVFTAARELCRGLEQRADGVRR